MTPRTRTFVLRAGGGVAVLLGLMSVVEGGRVVLGDEAARAAHGDYVPFVVWFNFLAGFAYVAAGAGLALGRRWAGRLALGIAAATLLVFAAFAVHVLAGGAYEAKTVGAMTVRSALWCLLAFGGLRRDRVAGDAT